jgi:hypothetical protein
MDNRGGSRGLEAKAVVANNGPSAKDAAVRIQTVLDFDAKRRAGTGPVVACRSSTLAMPPVGHSFAVVDATGKVGELVTDAPGYYATNDRCASYVMRARWLVSPTRAVDTSHATLAIDPPSACGPGCRVLSECQSKSPSKSTTAAGGAAGSCGPPIPTSVPLPALDPTRTVVDDWWVSLSVDLDGDDVGDLLFLKRTWVGWPYSEPQVEEVVVQRTATGWVTLPPFDPAAWPPWPMY